MGHYGKILSRNAVPWGLCTQVGEAERHLWLLRIPEYIPKVRDCGGVAQSQTCKYSAFTITCKPPAV